MKIRTMSTKGLNPLLVKLKEVSRERSLYDRRVHVPNQKSYKTLVLR